MPTFHYFAGHTYQVNESPKNWASANSFAQSNGGHLATLSSIEEHLVVYYAALYQMYPSGPPTSETLKSTALDGGGASYVWLGASDISQEGTWKWVDNADLSSGYTQWGYSGQEPDNFTHPQYSPGGQNGLAMALTGWPYLGDDWYTGPYGQSGQWNDINTRNNLYFVIEWDSIKAGSIGNDFLYGTELGDLLDGAKGADQMFGYTGDDVYYIDNVGDLAIEESDEGSDSVYSSVTYSLGDNLENLTLIGTGKINGTGNALDNVVTGNSGVNTLNGGAGADTLIGGAGNDIYIVDDSSDTVTESVGAGIDEVRSSVTFTLGDNFENLVLTGSSDLSGNGNSLANKITGNAGANTLDGGAGADTLIGGAGDDIYIVDNIGDKTTEVAAQGTDTIRSSITWTALAANVENLTLTGTGTINGTGNTLNNIITGNSGNNILSGGAGNDTIDGGDGADTINGDAGNDTLSANAGGGTINGGVGNDTLYGGTGTDTLDGGAGNDVLYNSGSGDTLIGGAGNDTYYIDNGTTLRESANGGIDTIITSVSTDLTGLTNHENLTLTGSSPLFGIGNTLANTIIGNDGDNTINGGLGNDTLTGGLGNDIFIFNTAPNRTSNVDRITDFSLTDDTIQLENAVFTGLGSGTGTLDSSMFRSGAGVTTAGDSSDRIIYNTTSGALFYDADGTGATAAVQIALIGNQANLTVNDLVII